MANPDEMGLEVAKAAAEGAGRESVNKVSEFFRTIFPLKNTLILWFNI